jgi:hypothetical protein
MPDIESARRFHFKSSPIHTWCRMKSLNLESSKAHLILAQPPVFLLVVTIIHLRILHYVLLNWHPGILDPGSLDSPAQPVLKIRLSLGELSVWDLSLGKALSPVIWLIIVLGCCGLLWIAFRFRHFSRFDNLGKRSDDSVLARASLGWADQN